MDYQFCAEITEFKVIHNVLKAISFKEVGFYKDLKYFIICNPFIVVCNNEALRRRPKGYNRRNAMC